MKILITGINGMLGTELAGVLEPSHEVTGIDIESAPSGRKVYKVDLTDSKTTYDAIIKVNPDIVIHTAAVTNVDQCETEPDFAYKLNAIATRNVAAACQRFDAAMLYISTDYVFSGTGPPKTGYTEFDRPGPISVYGDSKYAGELFVKELLNKHFIVRTSWLFGHLRANFVTQIADALKSGKPVKTASDMTSSPTYAKDLSHAIEKLIKTNLYGTYHLCNSGFASRYAIGLEIAGMLKLPDKNVKKIKIEKLKLPAGRPRFSGMRNYVWELNGFKPMRPWQEAVKEFLNEKGYFNA
ncbi:MAG: dTDP-4-dehydrorhamnose reductase [Elusimicrobiota bacterium]